VGLTLRGGESGGGGAGAMMVAAPIDDGAVAKF